MKYIFSRKGFDSTAGGYPSLIFPDNSLFSIPIPSTKDKYTYSDLDFNYESDSIQKVLNDLTGKNIQSEKQMRCDYLDSKQFCHYDPMLMKGNNFQGLALGQANTAEGHLRNQGVSNGDVFLFYGWFKKIKKEGNTWRYSDSQDIHLIWSYMKIEEALYLDTNEQQDIAIKKHPFLKKHPHTGNQNGSNNRIYLSQQHKFFSFDTKRCLTDINDYKGRSTWRLPACFHQPDAFSFLNNFVLDGDETVVSYRGYGQEFVLNLDNVMPDTDNVLIADHIDHIIE